MKEGPVKNVLLIVWNAFCDVKFWIRDRWALVFDRCYCLFVSRQRVVSLEDTLHYILEHRCSVARYGDGEMKFIIGTRTWFQTPSDRLREGLAQTLVSDDPNLIVCIPGVFGSLDMYIEEQRQYWSVYMGRFRRQWYRHIRRDKTYYEAFISRCYLPYMDKSKARLYFDLWKQLWNDRDILIVEGAKTRLGVGNDLFDNALSIKRILGPNTDAFAHYDELIAEVRRYNPNDYLVLIALGPTATVMAADLSRDGYQAVDIGHIDIEYEWMLMGVDHKVPVNNKFVNEAGMGRGVGECLDEKYQNEIIKEF